MGVAGTLCDEYRLDMNLDPDDIAALEHLESQTVCGVFSAEDVKAIRRLIRGSKNHTLPEEDTDG